MPDQDFVQLDFDANESDLVDGVITDLQTQWGADWIPEDADQEVVYAEALAPLAANAIRQAANMPMAALIAFGVKVLGQAYGTGTSAYTTVTFTVQDTAGYKVDAGSQLEIDNFVFQTTEDGVVPNGSTTVDVLVASTDLTSTANGLTGTSSLTSLTLPGFVTGMAVLAPSTGGSDPQSDIDYVNQVSRDRRLTSKAIITLLDAELAALDVAGIGRAHADKDLARNVTVTVTDTNGNAASTVLKNAVLAVYADPQQRTTNATYAVADPSFTTVNVTYTVQSETGFDPADLQARINAALAQELSPLGWGVPQSGDPGNGTTTWINTTTVYLNRLIGVISSVAGVYRVTAIAISASNVAHLSALLSTGGAITTLPVTALVNALPAGNYTLTDPTGAHTQVWAVTAPATVGATSLTVTSQTPNFAYPAGSVLSGAVTGDLALSGTVVLPQPGTFTGTVT